MKLEGGKNYNIFLLLLRISGNGCSSIAGGDGRSEQNVKSRSYSRYSNRTVLIALMHQ